MSDFKATVNMDKLISVFSIAVATYRDTIHKLRMITYALLVLYIITLISFCVILSTQVNKQACNISAATLPITAVAMHKLKSIKVEKRETYA